MNKCVLMVLAWCVCCLFDLSLHILATTHP